MITNHKCTHLLNINNYFQILNTFLKDFFFFFYKYHTILIYKHYVFGQLHHIIFYNMPKNKQTKKINIYIKKNFNSKIKNMLII